jgi:hypothetical protein
MARSRAFCGLFLKLRDAISRHAQLILNLQDAGDFFDQILSHVLHATVEDFTGQDHVSILTSTSTRLNRRAREGARGI